MAKLGNRAIMAKLGNSKSLQNITIFVPSFAVMALDALH